jgi:hypothetical protein
LLQKEKEKFVNQLEAKRRALERLENLNQAKEQIEKKYKESFFRINTKRD